MRINNNSGNFQPCPEYTGPAVCVDVTPLKTMQTQYGPKDKFRFVFETGELKEDGSPWCVWSAPFTASYHENSALRPFLRKWMGRELSAKEIDTFDTEDMLGCPAQLTVIHEHANGNTYANIALIQPDKSATALTPSGRFVRMKDRPPKEEAAGGQDGYHRVQQAGANGADPGTTKIHVGRCKGLEVRDLAPEQVQALIEKWLPEAKQNPKPTADDKRLIAALEAWAGANASGQDQEDDNVPY